MLEEEYIKIITPGVIIYIPNPISFAAVVDIIFCLELKVFYHTITLATLSVVVHFNSVQISSKTFLCSSYVIYCIFKYIVAFEILGAMAMKRTVCCVLISYS
jgi:hypothetical protein